MDKKNSDQQSNQPSLDELISLSAAAVICGLTASQLRLLVSRGDMWGRKLGRNWFTTEQAVRDYKNLGRKPGPKPKKSK